MAGDSAATGLNDLANCEIIDLFALELRGGPG